ncbi:structural maintenance of chromosomes protein 4 [Octopus sinensis]|nr:structural maintenance of chromosomes protein 4 [Octopus sinensis]
MVSKRRKPTAAAAAKEQKVDQENEMVNQDGAESVPLMTPVTHIFRPEDFGPVEVPPIIESVATYSHDGPRLMISHIENYFFKSYANTQIIGPFHKCFTSIVGPNGSGKSNVIDSMLFVFGYRANKIRSKKISVLIHNSQQYPNVESCTVSVHFQKIIDTGPGDEEYEVVPDSKFVVSRVAFRDNSSYYMVDGKRKTYKEIAALLRGSGVDLDHNRFLILQGEVEQIAMMKPKAENEHSEGMLEFLEDIVGSSRFKEPIEIMSKRVETLNELRGEKLNRVKAVEKEKDNLEGAKNEAEEFLSTEDSITHLNNKLYQIYLNDCAANESKATASLKELQEKADEESKKMKTVTAEKLARSKEYDKTYKEYEALVKESDQLKEKFSKLESLDVKCREDMKHTKGKPPKIEKSITQELKKIGEFKSIPEEAEKVLVDLRKKLETLEAKQKEEVKKVQEVMKSLKIETKDLQEEKDKQEEQLLGMQKSVSESKSQYNVAQSELDIYLSNEQNEQSKLNELQRNLTKATNTLKDRQSQIKDMEQKIPTIQKNLEKSKKELEQATELEKNSSEQLRNARLKIEEMKMSMQSAKSKGRVLSALMEQKRRGKLPGILGRLGDLGAIDSKFDCAISTACGALDNILVDTIDTARHCIEFLKANNVGSTTFICLDKMDKWKSYCNRKITTPESVPRLFDLVKIKDSTIAPAFYFALRDTLVAKDLDQATRIAYGKTRYKVVTLQGALIDISGTISGGGNTVLKGRMGSSVIEEIDPKELEKAEKALVKLTDETANIRQKKNKLESYIQELEDSLKLNNICLQKYSMEVKALSEQEITLTQQIVVQKEKVKSAAPDKAEVDNLQKKVEKLKSIYEKDAKVVSKIEKEVQRLHKEIMDIGGNKLKAVQARVDAISNNIDQVTGQITKTTVGVTTSKRNLKKSQEKLESLEKEKEEMAKKLEALNNEFKDLEEKAKEVLSSHSEVKEKIENHEKILSDLKEKLGEIEKEETALSKENIDLQHKLEKYEDVVKTNQVKMKHWKKQLSQLTLHAIGNKEPPPLETVDAEELARTNVEELKYEITVLEEKLSKMKPNLTAINEYREKEAVYLKRVAEMDQITDCRDQQKQMFEDLRKQRLDEFMTGFSTITNRLKEMYQMITLGGDAELELVDSLDPFSEGIVFSVRPPKKSWKNISNLSGGEKTLSSLALVFALHHFKPTPLYVMDEIDAALDFKNVSIVANYIKERTKNAQFIIISLRNNMFELADRLVGIYKTDNCTKSLTINPQKLSKTLLECDA